MVLIIGGAWQGKRDFARKTFGLAEEDIFTCAGEGIDFSRRCVDRLERFCLECAERGEAPVAIFLAREDEWKDAVLICEDIQCGVVPLGADMRAWREATGRLCRMLAERAERVSRLFCGLEQRLK